MDEQFTATRTHKLAVNAGTRRAIGKGAGDAVSLRLLERLDRTVS